MTIYCPQSAAEPLPSSIRGTPCISALFKSTDHLIPTPVSLLFPLHSVAAFFMVYSPPWKLLLLDSTKSLRSSFFFQQLLLCLLHRPSFFHSLPWPIFILCLVHAAEITDHIPALTLNRMTGRYSITTRCDHDGNEGPDTDWALANGPKRGIMGAGFSEIQAESTGMAFQGPELLPPRMGFPSISAPFPTRTPFSPGLSEPRRLSWVAFCAPVGYLVEWPVVLQAQS